MKDQHLPKPMFLTVLDDVLDVLPECMQVFWGTKWYKHMRFTIATFEHMGYWGEYGVHSNFFAIPSLLYHPRRFVLAERFNTRWVFLTLEMNASWNLWVWDGNSKPKYKKQVQTVWSLFSPTCMKISTRLSLPAPRFFQRSWISWGTWMAPDGLRSQRRLNLPSTAA